MNMRRTLIIATVALVILAIAAGVYIMFFLNPKSPTGQSGTPSSQFPIAGQSGGSGSSGAQGSGSSGSTPGATPGVPAVITPRLVQISAGPVVPGEIVLDSKVVKVKSATTTPSKVSVQYLERESGNVFSYSATDKTLTRINNKTIPGLQSALWLPDGSSALVQYLSGADFSTVNTYALASSSLNGFFLTQNLSGVAVSPTQILTVVSSGLRSSVSLLHQDGTKATSVFTTPLNAVRVSFLGKSQYLVFSKPSATLAGNAYVVNSLGRFSSLAGPLNGLTALGSPSGEWVLLSYISNTNTLRTELVSVATGEATALPVATIAADKCVWAADSSAVYCGVPMSPATSFAYPDDWYQGAASFSDRIWKVNVASRYAEMVLDFSQANKGTLDATALAVDPNATTLVFVNKNDRSLWAYSL